jgi:DNA invertase Pin-like site-specific DNA recombinase
MLVGYARVSTTGQSLDIQEETLKAAGCDKVFSEKRSGASQSDRAALEEAIEYVRDGDVLMVTRLDRLARSVIDLRNIIARLEAKGAGFSCIQQGAIDTTRSDGKLLLNILGSFAEFELDIRKERQMEGIAKAKDMGKYKGRPASVDAAKVKAMKLEGLGATDISKALGIGRASVYRALGDPAA